MSAEERRRQRAERFLKSLVFGNGSPFEEQQQDQISNIDGQKAEVAELVATDAGLSREAAEESQPVNNQSDTAKLSLSRRIVSNMAVQSEVESSAQSSRRKRTESFLSNLISGITDKSSGIIKDSLGRMPQIFSHFSEDSINSVEPVETLDRRTAARDSVSNRPSMPMFLPEDTPETDEIQKGRVHLVPKTAGKNLVFAKLDLKRDVSFEITFRENSRVFLTSPLGSPVFCFSMIRFQDDKRRKRRLAQNLPDKFASVDSLRKRRDAESYAHLLQPAINGLYDPHQLDDPELKTGKHRTVISLPSYIASIIQYTRPSELKQELNDQFKAANPDLDSDLSLSKIRNLKTHLLEIGLSCNLELSTIAKTYTFFEKLVMSKFVSKENRKLIAGTCLLLAAKINDHKELKFDQILNEIEKQLYVSAKDVREHEFPVFAALEFNLHIQKEEYVPHLDRIVSILDYNSITEYLSGKEPPNRQLQYI